MNRHMQLIELTLAQPPSPPRWQSDRRSGANAGPRDPEAGERRSGVDNRRQPRMPRGQRPIYPD